MSDIKVLFKRKELIENDCRLWAYEINKSYSSDLIVFIAKSGFLFAKPMAEYFGCPMVDIKVSRPGNDGKDLIRRIIPRLPKWLLAALLKSKVNYGYQEKNKERDIVLSESFNNVCWERYHKVLIVDDSTDTGWSLIAAKKEIAKKAMDCDIRTASYCVLDYSKSRVSVDFYRYENTIVVTATSRYSNQYKDFVNEFNTWVLTHKGGAPQKNSIS